MINNIFLDYSEFGGFHLLAQTNAATIATSQKKSSPPVKYLFKIFQFECCSTKDQKIILDTFYQISRKKSQYLQCYNHLSFLYHTTYTPTFSMKYISSKTLEQVLKTPNLLQSWGIEDFLKCLFAVSEAMSYLHNHLIYHGNLCPSNIIIDEANQFYLCDFGLYPIKKLYIEEKYLFNEIYRDSFMGNNEPTFKNDIYSYGVLICELFFAYFNLKNNSNEKENLSNFIKNSDTNKFAKFPQFFSKLIQECLNSSINERPSFKQITDSFKTTTENVLNTSIQKVYNEFIKSNYLLNLASKNDSFALNKIGEMYDNGKYFKQDIEKAKEFYKKAAELNNSKAQNNYGVLLQDNGDENEADLIEGARYLKLSAEQGNVHGMANYGVALLKGEGVEQNFQKAIQYLKKSADKGLSYAQVNYGQALLDYHPTSDEINEGLNYIKKAMNQNDPEAFYKYGVLLLNGKYIEKNEALAMEYFKAAADNDYELAMVEYARGNLNGIGVDKNDEVALKYFSMAFENGDETVKGEIDELIKEKGNKEKVKKSPKQLKTKTKKVISSSQKSKLDQPFLSLTKSLNKTHETETNKESENQNQNQPNNQSNVLLTPKSKDQQQQQNLLTPTKNDNNNNNNQIGFQTPKNNNKNVININQRAPPSGVGNLQPKNIHQNSSGWNPPKYSPHMNFNHTKYPPPIGTQINNNQPPKIQPQSFSQQQQNASQVGINQPPKITAQRNNSQPNKMFPTASNQVGIGQPPKIVPQNTNLNNKQQIIGQLPKIVQQTNVSNINNNNNNTNQQPQSLVKQNQQANVLKQNINSGIQQQTVNLNQQSNIAAQVNNNQQSQNLLQQKINDGIQMLHNTLYQEQKILSQTQNLLQQNTNDAIKQQQINTNQQKQNVLQPVNLINQQAQNLLQQNANAAIQQQQQINTNQQKQNLLQQNTNDVNQQQPISINQQAQNLLQQNTNAAIQQQPINTNQQAQTPLQTNNLVNQLAQNLLQQNNAANKQKQNLLQQNANAAIQQQQQINTNQQAQIPLQTNNLVNQMAQNLLQQNVNQQAKIAAQMNINQQAQNLLQQKINTRVQQQQNNVNHQSNIMPQINANQQTQNTLQPNNIINPHTQNLLQQNKVVIQQAQNLLNQNTNAAVQQQPINTNQQSNILQQNLVQPNSINNQQTKTLPQNASVMAQNQLQQINNNNNSNIQQQPGSTAPKAKVISLYTTHHVKKQDTNNLTQQQPKGSSSQKVLEYLASIKLLEQNNQQTNINNIQQAQNLSQSNKTNQQQSNSTSNIQSIQTNKNENEQQKQQINTQPKNQNQHQNIKTSLMQNKENDQQINTHSNNQNQHQNINTSLMQNKENDQQINAHPNNQNQHQNIKNSLMQDNENDQPIFIDNSSSDQEQQEDKMIIYVVSDSSQEDDSSYDDVNSSSQEVDSSAGPNTNLSINELIEKGDNFVKNNDQLSAFECFKEAARRGCVDVLMKCARYGPSFETKLEFYELAMQNKIPDSFSNWRKTIMKRVALKNDHEMLTKFAKLFEKYKDFSDAAFFYKKCKDKINFTTCYKLAKEMASQIEDGGQQYDFAILLKNQGEIELALSMFKKALENGVLHAKGKINEIEKSQEKVEQEDEMKESHFTQPKPLITDSTASKLSVSSTPKFPSSQKVEPTSVTPQRGPISLVPPLPPKASQSLVEKAQKLFNNAASSKQQQQQQQPLSRSPADLKKAESLFKEGLELFEGRNGKIINYYRAFELFKQAGELGSANANYYLGTMNKRGIVVKKDYNKAMIFFKLASSQGSHEAALEYGREKYEHGETKAERDEGKKCLLDLATKSSADTVYKISKIFKETNYKISNKLFKQAVDGGSELVRTELGWKK